MRAKEFVTENTLLEYSREVTIKNMGQQIVGKAKQIEYRTTPEFHSPESEQRFNKDVLDWIIPALENTDPTPNKKYTQWLARNYIRGNTKLEDVTSTVAEALHKFDLLSRRKKLTPEYSDINKYSSFGNFLDVMDQFELPVDQEVSRGQAKVVYEDDKVKVIVPEDQDAACYYGRGTRWCTAATKAQNYFNHYNRQGPMYILLPKNPKWEGEKYQLHFPSEQWMDENDEPVDLAELVFDRFPGVSDFIKQNVPEAKSLIIFADDGILDKAVDEVWDLVQEYIDIMVLDWQDNDDSYHQFLLDDGIVDDEGNIDWDNAMDYLDYNTYLKDSIEFTEQLVRLSPSELRELASDSSLKEDITAEWGINGLDALLSSNLDANGKGDIVADDVRNFIRTHILVRFWPETGQVTVRKV